MEYFDQIFSDIDVSDSDVSNDPDVDEKTINNDDMDRPDWRFQNVISVDLINKAMEKSKSENNVGDHDFPFDADYLLKMFQEMGSKMNYNIQHRDDPQIALLNNVLNINRLGIPMDLDIVPDIIRIIKDHQSNTDDLIKLVTDKVLDNIYSRSSLSTS